jgi:ABC-2 type transport system permease protein
MFDWSRVWLIAKRELTMRFKQRSYRWTTIVQVVIIALLALAPVLIAKFGPDSDGGDGASSGSLVVVVDEADANLGTLMPLYLDAISEDMTPIEVDTADTPEAARHVVDDGDADTALIATRDADGQLVFDLVNEDGESSSLESQRIIAAASAAVMQDRVETSGLSASDAQEVFTPPAVTITSASGEVSDDNADETDFASYIIAFLATILIFMAVVLYGQWIATGVVEEKSSRIMEIMVNAATPRDLLAGKVIGIMLAALCQFGPMLLVGGLIFGLQPQIADLMGVNVNEVLDVDFGALSLNAVGWFLIYFLLGFVLYGSLYAGVGSLVSRQEEVSTAIAPMTMVMFLGYFAAISSLTSPDTAIAKAAFLFPLTSPFVAVTRILLGDPSGAEIAISLVLLVIAVLGAMWLAGRLYRIGVLMYGQRPGFKTLLRMGRMQHVTR